MLDASTAKEKNRRNAPNLSPFLRFYTGVLFGQLHLTQANFRSIEGTTEREKESKRRRPNIVVYYKNRTSQLQVSFVKEITV